VWTATADLAPFVREIFPGGPPARSVARANNILADQSKTIKEQFT
jgi:hypothetical protein